MRQRRFIPAGAGNTLGLGLGLGSDAVYPRWRGEHTSFSLNDNPQRGLSPLARGTRKIAMSWLRPLAVYPRWRGEHSRREPGGLNNGGLSPLARGTRGDRSYDPAWLRFIPAGAGNTWLQTNQPASGSVYPRWRGEHQHEKLFTVVAHGLSPLARGTH
ncbi:CRISPR associated protein of unknown function [Salmonella enterica subsp. enterica serovar Typhimurium]|nr:CRISPR associated protein of unknown function [Salmonella enterica subsp. enterica serovar Typhimurium]